MAKKKYLINPISLETPQDLLERALQIVQNTKPTTDDIISIKDQKSIEWNNATFRDRDLLIQSAYDQIIDNSDDLLDDQKKEVLNWLENKNYTQEDIESILHRNNFGQKYGINKNNIINKIGELFDNSGFVKHLKSDNNNLSYVHDLDNLVMNLSKNYKLKQGDITKFLNNEFDLSPFVKEIGTFRLKQNGFSDDVIRTFQNRNLSDSEINNILHSLTFSVPVTTTQQIKIGPFDKYGITNKDTQELLKKNFKTSGFNDWDTYMLHQLRYNINSDGTYNSLGFLQNYNSLILNLALKESIPKLRQSLISNILLNNPLSINKEEIEKINLMSDDELIEYYNSQFKTNNFDYSNIFSIPLYFRSSEELNKILQKAELDYLNTLTENDRKIYKIRRNLDKWNDSWMSWIPGLNTIAQAGFAGTLHGLGDQNWSDVGASALSSLGYDAATIFMPWGKVGQGISKVTSPVTKAMRKFAETTAGKYITAVPKFGYNMGKYMITHPIESFVLPEIIRSGTESGFNYLENEYGWEVDPKAKNAIGITASVLIPGMGMNFLRNRFGTKLYDATLNGIERLSSETASKLSNNNNFRNLFFSDLGYTRSGALPSLKWNDIRHSFSKDSFIKIAARENIKSDFKNLFSLPTLMHVAGRRFVPETLTATATGSQAYLPDGSITNTLLNQYKWNPILANMTDFGINAMLSHTINKGTNMLLNLPIMMFKQLSGGAQTQYVGFTEFFKNLPNMKKIGWNHYTDNNGNSYQLMYNRSKKQVDSNISKNASHTTKNSNSDNLETLMGYNFKNLKVGDKILDDRAVISGIIPSGSKRVNNDFSTELGRLLNNRSSRYLKGQDIRVIKTANSEELPSLKEMSKSGEWEALSFDGSSNIQIKEGVDIPMLGVYGDFKLNTNPNGSTTFLNPGGHQLSLIKNKRTGEIYAIETDLSGTGSTTRGSNLSIISDSAQSPYILSKITKIDPNIPIEKQLGLMSIANRTELPGTLGMMTENLFNFKNLKLYGKYNDNHIWFPNFKNLINTNINKMNQLNLEYKNTPLYYTLYAPTKEKLINFAIKNYTPVSNLNGTFWKPFTINDNNALKIKNDFDLLKAKLNQIIQNNI